VQQVHSRDFAEQFQWRAVELDLVCLQPQPLIVLQQQMVHAQSIRKSPRQPLHLHLPVRQLPGGALDELPTASRIAHHQQREYAQQWQRQCEHQHDGEDAGAACHQKACPRPT
jgi:hypothetical protein